MAPLRQAAPPLLCVLLAVLPSAEAGMRAGEVQDPEGPIDPATEVGTLAFDVAIDCTSVLARTLPPSGTEFQARAEVEAPPEVVVSGEMTSPVRQEDCAAPTDVLTVPFELQVGLLREAAAFEDLPLAITVSIPESPVDPVPAVEMEGWVTPGAFILYEASASSKLVTTNGTFGEATVNIENFSNCPLLLTFSAVAPHGGEVEVPTQGTLGAPGEEGASQPLHVLFHAPKGRGQWAVNITMLASPVGSSDPFEPSFPVHVNLVFRGDGRLGKDSPAPTLPAALAAIAGAALLARLRRA